MSAGDVGKFAPIAVKLKGEIATTYPSFDIMNKDVDFIFYQRSIFTSIPNCTRILWWLHRINFLLY
jgi:hypothetical protein